MNTWFTGDFHLFHTNIIKYSNRPFKHTGEMNRAIIDRLNEKVDQNDWLYFLGDLAYGRESNVGYVEVLLDQIKCKNICVIKGNHDKIAYELRNRFVWFKDYNKIEVQGQEIVLCHYAMRVWDKSHYGSWHLFGHSHGSLPDDPNALSMDVGVDTNNFYPYSFSDIQSIMSKKKFKPIDHHGRK